MGQKNRSESQLPIVSRPGAVAFVVPAVLVLSFLVSASLTPSHFRPYLPLYGIAVFISFVDLAGVRIVAGAQTLSWRLPGQWRQTVVPWEDVRKFYYKAYRGQSRQYFVQTTRDRLDLTWAITNRDLLLKTIEKRATKACTPAWEEFQTDLWPKESRTYVYGRRILARFPLTLGLVCLAGFCLNVGLQMLQPSGLTSFADSFAVLAFFVPCGVIILAATFFALRRMAAIDRYVRQHLGDEIVVSRDGIQWRFAAGAGAATWEQVLALRRPQGRFSTRPHTLLTARGDFEIEFEGLSEGGELKHIILTQTGGKYEG